MIFWRLRRTARPLLPHVIAQPPETLLAGAAFVALHYLGFVGPLPLAELLGLLAVAGMTDAFAQARWGPGSDLRQLHARLALEMAATSVVIYAIGWGPALAVGYMVVAAEDLRSGGSQVWRPAIFWSVAWMAVGQLAVAAGIAPTYIPAPYVHGLAALAALGLAFVIRMLGLKTASLEAETAQRAQAEEAVRHNEERFRSLVQNSSEIVTVLDPAGHVTYVSPSVQRLLGYRPDEGKDAFGLHLVHPDDLASAHDFFGAVLANPGVDHTTELRVRRADGNWRWHEVTARNLLADPAVGGIVANWDDITERRAYQDRLAYEARHDALTGLANRTAFIERLERAVEMAPPGGRSPVVLFADLDHFKVVNDSLGHHLGDQVLQEAGRRLQTCAGAAGVVARLAGDEFTVLLAHLPDPDEAARVAERIVAEMGKPMEIGGREILITASVGVARGGDGADSAEDLLRNADLAMYMAKEGGRARTATYDRHFTPAFQERMELEAGLRSALNRQEFVLHYQPIVSLRSGRVTGFEALIRWQHPDRGLLGPATFIKLAEDSGFIVPLGRWVLAEACRFLVAHRQPARRRRGGAPHLTVSVNVSPVQLNHPSFPADVAQIVRTSGVNPACLIIELTEGLVVEPARVVPVLNALHDQGVAIALDDFGTGFSSLSYLRDLPLDYVKIDRSFVTNLSANASALAVVTAVSELARKLGLATVAEGVETPAEADSLAALGCDYAQGYLFARPSPAQEAVRFIACDQLAGGPAAAKASCRRPRCAGIADC